MKRKNSTEARLNQDTELRRSILHKVFANSVLQSRASYGNTQTFNGLRDVYSALGYPAIDKITYKDFYVKFKRQDIAAAIINKPVYGAWKKTPIVRTGGEDKDTFRDAWEKIAKEFRLFSIFQRVDKLAGIGRYATLYIGVNDGAEFPSETIGNSSVLLYVQPYSEENAVIKTADTDSNSSRFGQPDKYGLRSVAIEGGVIDSGSYKEVQVDHSRIIHIADNLLENNVWGMSRLENVYNRLLNLELIVGGGAEMFWQGAFPGLAFNVQEGYELSAEDVANLETEIEKYVHNIERYMKLKGIDVNSLSSSVADPSNHVETQLKMISIATGIPKRILEGSERGELASSQDTKAWNEYLDNRRTTFCEYSILRPTVDKFIEVGILPTPEEDYIVEWPDLETTGEKEKAEVGKIRAESIKSYTSSPETQMVIPPKSFLEEIMDLDPDKVERVMKEQEDVMRDVLDSEIEADETEQEDMENLED